MEQIKYGPDHLRRESLTANLLEIVDCLVSLGTLGNYRTTFLWDYLSKNVRKTLDRRIRI